MVHRPNNIDVLFTFGISLNHNRVQSTPELSIVSTAHGEHHLGILGQTAPELVLGSWIDGEGRAVAPIRLKTLKGIVVYLYFFQDW